jgi:excisionase family DNA binding protein
MDNNLISISEAASILSVSKLTLRNWDRDGKLTALRHPISNYRVYQREDINKIIDKIKSGDKPVRPPRKAKMKSRTLKVIHLDD